MRAAQFQSNHGGSGRTGKTSGIAADVALVKDVHAALAPPFDYFPGR
jgi:hypothetical protein